MKTYVHPNHLKIAAMFASKDDTRPILQSVYVKQGEIAATDTLRLVKITETIPEDLVDSWPDKGLILPTDNLIKAMKALKRKRSTYGETWATERLLLTADRNVVSATNGGEVGDVTVKIEPTEGQFPGYERALDHNNSTDAQAEFYVNPRLLGESLLALGCACNHVRVCVPKNVGQKHSVGAVRISGTGREGEEIVALVMPTQAPDQ